MATYDLSEILITKEELDKRVAELGAKITEDYKGESVLLIGILKGSVPFMADLMRHIDLDVCIDFMSVSSYGGATKSSGVVRILKDLDSDIKGKNVIIVEDIIDSGLTLSYLKDYLLSRNPASMRICTLLDKPSRRKVDLRGDYVGFEVEDKFIVGYGLDIDQKYRNLPYISWVKVNE
ncbi:MAG: hypoxanthine phosphoribosyltransferase [Clostridia bacterium]|nr:hypoxanthine phosphoribosyltransferase [Clostridia bacterium]